MSRTRQKKQSEEVRNRILDIARRTISEQGAEALSVRRIAKEIDYSVGIIYHYFESKEQIVTCILQESYKKILTAVNPQDDNLPTDEIIRVSLIRYIESALEWQSEYKAVMLSSMPQILDFTSILSEGTCEKRPALMMLVSALETGISEELFAPCDTRLTAQAIWSAVFGLTIRLMIECDVSEKQRTKLIECQVNMILKGLKK